MWRCQCVTATEFLALLKFVVFQAYFWFRLDDPLRNSRLFHLTSTSLTPHLILMWQSWVPDSIIIIFSPPQCHHMSFVDFVVLPPGHGRSVTDFWGWGAHEVQLRCPDGVWVVIEEDVVPGGTLNLKSTNLPRPWSPRVSSLSGKFPR